MIPLEHIDELFAYAMALTRNRYEAEDLVQETYLRAIQAMGRLREDGNAKAWLYTILRNIRLNEVRQQRIRPKLLELDANEDAANLVIETTKDPHALYVSKVETLQVRESIRQLSEEFREIILLREFAELSYQEIGTVLGCAQGTVMSRLARARSKLGALLTATQTPPPTTRNHTKELSTMSLSSSDSRETVASQKSTLSKPSTRAHAAPAPGQIE